jgi:hypothetical protein
MAGRRKNRGSIFGRDKGLYLLYSVQTGSGDHPAISSVDIGVSLLGEKAVGARN